MSAIQDLPDERAVQVLFEGLAPRTLLACAGVCASWRAVLNREDAWWEDKYAMYTPSLPRAEARRHLAKLRARLGCSWRQLCLSKHAAWLCGQLAVCKVAHRVSFRSMDAGPWEPLDAPHERCVTALLAPPWVFVHEAHSRHFFLKLMRADHVRCSNLAALVDAYSLEARKHWPALGLAQTQSYAQGQREFGMQQCSSYSGDSWSPLRRADCVVAMHLPLVAVGGGRTVCLWHADQHLPVAWTTLECASDSPSNISGIAFETGGHLADPDWLPAHGIGLAACSANEVQVWRIGVCSEEAPKGRLPMNRLCWMMRRRGLDTGGQPNLTALALWSMSGPTDMLFLAIGDTWGGVKVLELRLTRGSASMGEMRDQPLWHVAASWQGCFQGGPVAQLCAGLDAPHQPRDAAAAQPPRDTRGRLYVLINPGNGPGGSTKLCASDATGGPALPSAPCIRPRGAVGPSLGFARPGPVNVACCSLGIAPGDPAFHTVGDPCIRTHAAGACKGPATPAPAVGGRSPTWAGTLLGGTHAQPEVICQTHGVPGGLRTSAVRVQPLTTRWTEAVPGACHLAVAGGAIAVACGSGLLLLLDAASGALIRRVSNPAMDPFADMPPAERPPIVSCQVWLSTVSGVCTLHSATHLLEGDMSHLIVNAHVPTEAKEARCLCGHAAARGTRDLHLEPWQGGRVVRHVLTCGSPSAKRRCAYELYLD